MVPVSARQAESLVESARAERKARGGALKSVVFVSSMDTVYSPCHDDGYIFTDADWNVVGPASQTSDHMVWIAGSLAGELAFWRAGQRADAGFGMTVLCPS